MSTTTTTKVTRQRKQKTQETSQKEQAPKEVQQVQEAEHAPVQELVQDVVEDVVEEASLSFRGRLEVLIQANLAHIAQLKGRVQELRKLQREHEFLLKDAVKKTKKKKTQKDFTKPRRSTGFAEPVVVSDELYTFLVKTKATMKDTSFVPTTLEEQKNWPRVPVKTGVPVARTDVTSHLAKYIKEHNLQNPEFRREIVPDAALKKVFSEAVEVSKHDPTKKVYTYLKLQTYVNHHFPKKVSQ